MIETIVLCFLAASKFTLLNPIPCLEIKSNSSLYLKKSSSKNGVTLAIIMSYPFKFSANSLPGISCGKLKYLTSPISFNLSKWLGNILPKLLELTIATL